MNMLFTRRINRAVSMLVRWARYWSVKLEHNKIIELVFNVPLWLVREW